MFFYSIVVAAYKRTDELEEFLQSMIRQAYRNFEVIISDGSPEPGMEKVVMNYAAAMNLKYVYRKDFKASESRNVGVAEAKGEYVIFIDSDCIVPEQYLTEVNLILSKNPADAFGGPDRADSSFTPVMKAINYAMTSTFTTGGIRGKNENMGKFELRGFNMGVSKKVFEQLKGFSTMQVAEDIELSARIDKAGYSKVLIPQAFVYHKRKSDFKKFFKQLRMHGRGRIDLYLRHRDKLKPVHFLPTVFFLYFLSTALLVILFPSFGLYLATPLIIYFTAILIDSSIANKNLKVGLMSVWASFIMLFSYGMGLLQNFWSRIILNRKQEIEKDIILKL
jgi:cellulose synthase/poly-beta-1,6-N-acetylglucosamine synthase-like glycosyltransferase